MTEKAIESEIFQRDENHCTLYHDWIENNSKGRAEIKIIVPRVTIKLKVTYLSQDLCSKNFSICFSTLSNFRNRNRKIYNISYYILNLTNSTIYYYYN